MSLTYTTASSSYRYSATSSRFNRPLVPSVLNFPSITHLTGGNSTALDGLSAALLATLANGTRAVVGFTGGIVAHYRLRVLSPDTAVTQWLVVCANASTRAWQLEAVTKEGVGCVWIASESKFYQQLAALVDGVPTQQLADTGFALPT